MSRSTGPLPTMHDVAAAAGVSQATVSLVLNSVGGSRVSDRTRERVFAAVRELGYSPNAAAKTLRDGTAGLIGFVGDVVASSPFAGRIVEGAQDRAWEEGILLLAVNTGGDRAMERASIEALLSQRVIGIVYASMYHQLLALPPELEGIRTVVLNSEDAEGRIPSVVPDEYEGGRTATEHLLRAGHRRIAMINIASLESGLPAAVGRYEGYATALRDAGIEPDPDLYRTGDGNPDAGLLHAPDLLRRTDPPTAIFCANDRTAWGAYDGVAGLGLRVPDDVSIVGFDNQETLAPHLRPALTTVALPFAQMGRMAVDLLLSPKSGDDPVVRAECPLVVRQSVQQLEVPRVG